MAQELIKRLRVHAGLEDWSALGVEPSETFVGTIRPYDGPATEVWENLNLTLRSIEQAKLLRDADVIFALGSMLWDGCQVVQTIRYSHIEHCLLAGVKQPGKETLVLYQSRHRDIEALLDQIWEIKRFYDKCELAK